jgi:hypothetical protein
MQKNFIPGFFLLLVILCVYSCKKGVTETKICLNNSSVYYLKRWAAVFTRIETHAPGEPTKNTIIYPHGYFELNLDYTYSLYSDGPPVRGKWSTNDSCQFVLNAHTSTQRKFSVVTLTDDSLTITEYKGSTVYTEHYAKFTCPELTSIAYRWDNVSSWEIPYAGDKPVSHNIYTTGYLKLNPDASYYIFTTTTTNATVSGTWGIASPGCLLVLDKNKSNERSYDVQKLTADSLVIWRKDTVAKVNYLQYYKKHK